jgi:hypothetical protein
MKSDKRLSLTLSDLEALCGAALCAVDPDGTILAAGPRAENLLGSAPGGLKGPPSRPGEGRSRPRTPGTAPCVSGRAGTNAARFIYGHPPLPGPATEAEWFGPGATTAAEAARSYF